MKYPTLQEIFGFGKKDKKDDDKEGKWEYETMYEALLRLGYEPNKYGWLEDNSAPYSKKSSIVNLDKFWDEYPPGTPVKVKLHYNMGDARNLDNEPYFHDGFIKGDGYIVNGLRAGPATDSGIETEGNIQAYHVVIPSKDFMGSVNAKKVILKAVPKSQKAHSPYR